MFGMAFGCGIVIHRAFQGILCRVELKRRIVHLSRHTHELHLAVGIRPRLKIEMMKPAKSIRDVDLDGGVIHPALYQGLAQ